MTEAFVLQDDSGLLWKIKTKSYDQAFFIGGSGLYLGIDKVSFATGSIAASYGSITSTRQAHGTNNNATRAIISGGMGRSTPTPREIATQDYLQLQAASANTASFGSLANAARYAPQNYGNITHGFNVGGRGDSTGFVQATDRMAFSTLGSAANFGSLATPVAYGGGAGNINKGYVFGGYASNLIEVNTIQRQLLPSGTAVTGLSGALASTRVYTSAASNTIYAVVPGGYQIAPNPDVQLQSVDRFSISTEASAINCGNLVAGTSYCSGSAANSIRALVSLGYLNNAASTNTLESIMLSSLAQIADFGDMTVAVDTRGGASTAHGGLSDLDIPGSGMGIAVGGLVVGTSSPICVDVIEYLHLPSEANAKGFWSLSCKKFAMGAGANSTWLAVFGGQKDDPNGADQTTIEYIELRAGAGIVEFKALASATRREGVGSTATKVIIAGGAQGSSVSLSTIDSALYSTRTAPSSFGSMAAARYELNSIVGSSARLLMAGGVDNPTTGVKQSLIEYITPATASNATTFGNLTAAKRGMAGTSSYTRAVFAGGNNTSGSNIAVIDYVTLASVGNAAAFGNLSSVSYGGFGMTDTSKSIRYSGWDGAAASAVQDKLNIATLGNATGFGTVTLPSWNGSGTSDCHGGL